MTRENLWIIPALLAFQFLSCAGPKTTTGPPEIAVPLGTHLAVSLDRDASGQVRASVLPEGSASESAVTFALSDQGSYRLLKITNGTQYVVRMDVSVCIDRGARCAESNVLPLHPGKSNYESWGDPIDLVLLSHFQLESAN